MTLLDDFNGITKEYQNRTVAALAKAATDMLLLLLKTDPDYKQKALFAKHCLSSTPKSVRYVVRAMISQGIYEDALDPVLQQAISDNFDKLAAMFDPDLEG